MSSQITYFLLIVTSLAIIQAADNATDKCSSEFTSLDKDSGILEIPPNHNATCGFITKSHTFLFAVKTDHINFNAGDTVDFETLAAPPLKKTLKPPVINGYIISGEARSKITFNFNTSTSTETITAEYFQDQNLTINANLINDFYVEPVRLSRLPVKVVKTLPDPVLLEVTGAKINNKTNTMLITGKETVLNITVKNDQLFRVTTNTLIADEVLETLGPISKIPKMSGERSYLLKPGPQQFAAIQVSPSARFVGVNVTIYKAKEIVTTFTGGSLPPVVAIDEMDVPMIVKLTGKDLDKLNNLITFKPLATSCHRVITKSSGHISVNDAQLDSCIFILASREEIALSIDYNDLSPNGCLSIQQLSQDKPIYSNCNMAQTEVLPNFILKQAFVNVTLKANKTSLEASIRPSHLANFTQVELANKIDVTSNNYPVLYPWVTSDQTYSINASGKSYILSAVNIDLRAGEKLMAGPIEITNNSKILGDLDISNKVTNVTIKRQPLTNDFAIHQGFKLVASEFQSIVVANVTSNKTVTSNNVTSIFIKISSSSSKAGTFGQRIAYSLNFSNPVQDYELSVIDGRSILGLTVTDEQVKYHGSSTSDTLLITCKSKKPNVKIPSLTIQHSTLECNQTTDVICDLNTRCVPKDKLCKGNRYCDDGTDLRYPYCSPGVVPKPQIIKEGVSGVTVFILCVLMLTLGAVIALYGPDLIGNRLTFLRGGRYTTFTSSE